MTVFLVVMLGTCSVMQFQEIGEGCLLVCLVIVIDEQGNFRKVVEIRKAACSHQKCQCDRKKPDHGCQMYGFQGNESMTFTQGW